MKVVSKLCFILLLFIFLALKAEAMNFSEAYEQTIKKPMLMLIYADWASNYQEYINIMKSLETKYSDRLNFVELNIANPDTASFNSKFHIYPNLPYMLMFRDGGKVSRYIQRNCANDYSCVETKIKNFL